MHEVLVAVHGMAGAVALVTYWIAGFSRKGSPVHRRAGRVFLPAMWTILVTAVPITVAMYLRGNERFALFLGYLFFVVAESCWTSLRAVRLKRDPQRYFDRRYRLAAAALLAAGTGILGYGLTHADPLLIGFSFVGLVRGAYMLRLSRRVPAPRWALGEHLGAMIGNGVAIHVAFLLIGLGRLLPADWAAAVRLVAWFGPLAVALGAGIWLTRRYLAPARPAAAVPGTLPATR